MMDESQLVWNVYMENFSKKEIVAYNVFRHCSFLDDCREIARNYNNDFELFETSVDRSLIYYFWSKCEYEIVLSCWPPKKDIKDFDDKKISIYDQIKLNWDHFIKYLWENRRNLWCQTSTNW